MAEERILLDVEIRDTDAVQRMADLKAEIDDLRDANKTLQKAFKDGTLAQDDYTKAVVRNEQASKLLKTEYAALGKEQQNQLKIQRSAEGSNDKLKAQLSNLTAQLNVMGEAERTTTDKGKALSAQVLEITNQLKANEGAVGNNRRSVGGYEEAVGEAIKGNLKFADTIIGMKKQVELLERALESLPAKSKEFKQVKNAASLLRLEVQQVRGEVNEFGQREPRNPAKKAFDDAFKSVGAFSSGLGLANSLMGDNEDAGQALAKAVQAIAITQTVANIATEKSAIIATVQNTKNLVLTASQKLYTLAIGTTTGALKALRIAMAATGIGALIVGVTLLISFLTKNKKATDELALATDDYRKKIDDLEASLKNLNQESQQRQKSLDLDIELLKIQGASTDEIRKKENELAAERKLLTSQNITAKKQELSETDKLIKTLEAEIEAKEGSTKASRGNSFGTNSATKELKKLNEQLEEARKKHNEATFSVNELTGAFALLSEEERNINAKRKVEDKDERKKNLEKFRELKKQQVQDEATAQTEIKKLQAEAIPDETNRALALLKIQEDADRERINKSKASEETKQLLITQLELKGTKERLAILDKDIKDRGAKEKESQEKIFNEKIRGLEIERNEKLLLAQEEISDKKLLAQEEISDKKLLAQEEISDKKLLEQEKARIELEFLEKRLAAVREFAGADGLITQEEKLGIQAIEAELQSVQQRLSDATEDAPKVVNAIGLTDEEMGKMNDAFSGIQQSIGAIAQLSAAEAQNRINEIDNRLSEEIQAVQRSSINEEEKQAKIKQLENKAANDKYEIEKKEFETQKAFNIIQAVMGGALAGVQALANTTIPFPLSLLALIPIGLITAAQIAAISAAKGPTKPSFAKGGLFSDGGGYTGEGSPASESRRLGAKPYTYHADEYITPSKVLNRPEAWPHITALEAMRSSLGPSLGLRGFADGGFVPSSGVGSFSAEVDPGTIREAIREGMRDVKIITRVSDINRVQADVIESRVSSELR